jgi:hypothetical protein
MPEMVAFWTTASAGGNIRLSVTTDSMLDIDTSPWHVTGSNPDEKNFRHPGPNRSQADNLRIR